MAEGLTRVLIQARNITLYRLCPKYIYKGI